MPFEKIATEVLIGFVLLIATALGLFYVYLHFSSAARPTYSSTNTVNNVLTDSNSYFAQAEQLGKIIGTTATDTTARIDLYEKALAQSQDVQQQAQIKYKIAMATAQKGDYLAAVPLFKDIIANSAYPNITRAYSVQAMANLYHTYVDPAITSKIFTESPYAEMVVPKDTSASYRNLYQYAISFYPLALSEARVADSLATGLVRSKAASSSPEVRITLSKINADLIAMHKDIVRIQGDPNARVDVPGALMRAAVAQGKLAQLRLIPTSTPETEFMKAKDSYILIDKKLNPYWNFNYAEYLVNVYGTKKANEVRDTLSVFNTQDLGPLDMVSVFLKNERANVSGHKRALQRMAALTPSFKAFLMSLGWTENDFSSR